MLRYLIIPRGILAIILITAITTFINRHGFGVVFVRFVSGLPLNGAHQKTNATWFSRGDTILHRSGRASWWSHLAHIERFGIRWISILSISIIIYGYKKNPSALFLGLIICAIVLTAGYIKFGARDHIVKLQTMKTTHPMASALGAYLGVTPSVINSSMSIVPDYIKTKATELVGRIILPDSFHATSIQQDLVEKLITARLGIETDFNWMLAKKPPILEIVRSAICPELAPMEKFVKEMEACEKGTVLMGLNAKEEPFYGSFVNDDPHFGASVSSGKGKSTWLSITVGQILHQDEYANATCIDPKMSSLSMLQGIPGVEIACDPRDVKAYWTAIDKVHALMMDRLDELKEDPTKEFPYHLLVIDELNVFSSQSRVLWRRIKPKGAGAVPPIWDRISEVLWMGRAVKISMVVVGQRLDDKSCGGIGLRDSLGLRAIAGWRPNQWAMLIGSHPIPRSSKIKGRWTYSIDEETIVQNLYAKPEFIRDYARANRRNRIATAEIVSSEVTIPEQRTESGSPRITIINKEY